jgi:ABC-type Fe3+/spermidine/putrescine transport system ATPase subunit
MNQGRIDQVGSPVEIYKRPASQFGAEFIGLANISSGEVVATGATTRVRLAGGKELTSGATGFRVGDSVEAVCRPEDVRISTVPLAEINAFPARVVACYFLGNIADVFVQAGQLPLRSQLSPPQMLPEGTEVWAQVAPEAIILIERQRASTKEESQ